MRKTKQMLKEESSQAHMDVMGEMDMFFYVMLTITFRIKQ